MTGAPGVSSSIGTFNTETSDTLGVSSATSEATSHETVPVRRMIKPVKEDDVFIQEPIPNGIVSSPEEITSQDSAGSTRATQVVAGAEQKPQEGEDQRRLPRPH